MQTVGKPGFSYSATVLFITSFGFLVLAGLINGFAVWKDWYDNSTGVGWLLTANVVLSAGFFICMSHAIALSLKNRQYCPTCGHRIK